MGGAVRRHPAVDRDLPAGRAELLAPPLRQDQRRLGGARSSCPSPLLFGFGLALYETLHTVLLEYMPFIILLLALFTITGGLRVRTSLQGTPSFNTGLLAFGTLLASWIGTTGAAMLLIRPLLRANAWRRVKVHVVVFFIFLVANIGGSLTPLGDPPLFLGFLKGVDFFWPTRAMFLPMLVLVGDPAGDLLRASTALLIRRERGPPPPPDADEPALPARGHDQPRCCSSRWCWRC